MMRSATLFVLALSAPALAGSVYLNGVRIDGVTNQRFDKVNVHIDEAGNLFIDAPGYSVRQLEGSHDNPAAPARTLSRQYVLVTVQTSPALTERDVQVSVPSR